MTPPQERSGRRRVPHTPPGFPIDVGAACTPPGNVVVARDLPGSENTPRRGTTPPYSSHTFAAKFPCGVAAGWGSRGLPAAVRRGQDPALLHTIREPHGRPAGRPYSRTGIGNFYFGFAIPARMHKPPVRGGFLFRSGFPRFSTGDFRRFICVFDHFPPFCTRFSTLSTEFSTLSPWKRRWIRWKTRCKRCKTYGFSGIFPFCQKFFTAGSSFGSMIPISP